MRNKNLIKLLIISLLIFNNEIIQAQEGFFIPNALVTPVHLSNNELHISLGLARGIDVNASYTLKNKFAIFGSLLYNQGTYTHTTFFGDKKNPGKMITLLQVD